MRRVVIITLFILLSLLVSCSCSGPASGGDTGTTAVNTSQSEQGLFDVYEKERTKEPVIVEDARYKIEEAFEKKEISEEEYIVLRFQEAFEPEALPAAYQSDEHGPRPNDNSFLFYMLRTRWDTFSPETKKALHKYYVPSWDPDSIWYDPEQKNELSMTASVDNESGEKLAAPVQQFTDWLTIVPAAAAVTNKLNGYDFKIYFVNSGDEGKATVVTNALVKAYKKYKAAGMAEPTDWIWADVQTIPNGDLGSERLENVMNDGVRRCTIRIERNQDTKHLETTAAHELFHCFQESMQLPNYVTDEWIWESTAVWSEEYVFPDYNTEHDYDPDYFMELNKDFLDKAENKDYGAYLWWFYLSQKAGKSPVPILKGLQNAKDQMGSRNSLKHRPQWYEEQKEFALWNVNYKPFKYYQDSDNKPSEIPYGDSAEYKDVKKGDKFSMPVDMDTGGMKYFVYIVNDNVKKLTFNLEGGNKHAHDKLGVQMIYKVGDNRLYEDVSDRDKVVFCRTRPSEKVSKVLLIVNNADLDNMFSGKHEVDASGKCTPGWSGYTRVKWSDSGSDNDLPTLSGDPTVGSWFERGSITVHDTLVYDQEYDEFLVENTSYSYNFAEHQQVNYDRPCGLLYTSGDDWMTGGGTKNWEINKDSIWNSLAPRRLESAEEGGGIYTLDIDTAVGKYMSRSQSIERQNTCPLFGITTPAPPENTIDTWVDYSNSETDGYVGVKVPDLHDYRVKLSEDRKRLTGYGEANFIYHDYKVPVQIDVDYSYG